MERVGRLGRKRRLGRYRVRRIDHLMQRGDIVSVDLEPVRGAEASKRRAAVVVSNDGANRALDRVQVVPLTSKTAKIYPGQALVVVDGRQSQAMADRIGTVSKLRLRGDIGALEPADTAAVDRAILTQLAL